MPTWRPTMTGEVRALEAAVRAGVSAARAARDLNRSMGWGLKWCRRLGLKLQHGPHVAPPGALDVARARLATTVNSLGYGLDAARFSPPASAVSGGPEKESPGAGPGLGVRKM